MKFAVSDQSVNSHGYIIKNSALDLSSVPLTALFNHDDNIIIGQWTKLYEEDGLIFGDLEWDQEDPESMKLMKKSQKGLLKGASIAISFTKDDVSINEAGVPEINNGKLQEISVVTFPSNKNAVKHSMCKADLYLDGKKLIFENMEELKMSLKSENKLELKTVTCPECDAKVSDFEDGMKCPECGAVINEADLGCGKKKMSEVKVETPVVETSVEKIELKENKVETIVTPEQTIILELKAIVTEKENTLLELHTKITDLENQLSIVNKEKENQEFEKLTLSAIKVGKISKENVETFKKMDLSIVKELLDKLPAKNSNKIELSKTPTGEDRSGWNFTMWNSQDRVGLLQLKQDDPEKYWDLYNNSNKK